MFSLHIKVLNISSLFLLEATRRQNLHLDKMKADIFRGIRISTREVTFHLNAFLILPRYGEKIVKDKPVIFSLMLK